jgi:dTDP-glucose 4,6-dehydratase
LKLLVTGGAGFIGSNFVKHRLEESNDEIIVLDKLTYAGNLENVPDSNRVTFYLNDICDPLNFEFNCLVNFAAETHVDRSIKNPQDFVNTDVMGTFNLLQMAKDNNAKYVQISTDEVYGSIDTGSFTENSKIDPSSPYSASKASADMFVSAFHKTYDLDTVIIRASNNYGPRQFPEKLIPLIIINALTDNTIPVYGNGNQVRNWLYVKDFCRAISTAIDEGVSGEVYNAGGPDELTNLEVIRLILFELDKSEDLIEFVKDRPGHDKRYSLSSKKLNDLDWEPFYDFRDGLDETISWYVDNKNWWEKLLTKEYRDYYLGQYGKYRKD